MRPACSRLIAACRCASSLVQGLEYYASRQAEDAIGLLHWEIGGYRPQDIEVVAAFDIDLRKVGKDVSVSGTPHFVINGRAINGMRGLEVFEKAVDRALAE